MEEKNGAYNLSLISISKISKNFADKTVLRNISFSIEENSKIGLVGKNGAGKTTLFNIITKQISADTGEVHIAKNRTIAYLSQKPNLNYENTLYEEVLSSRQEVILLHNKIEKIQNNLKSDDDLSELEKLQNKIESINGYHIFNEMEKILSILKFPKNSWNQKVKSFSGGEQSRIELAKILLKPYDVLFLDEPTNHLDFKMIFWLEKYLKNSNKPYVIVSHDRYFLDKTVTKILEISSGNLISYSGNYSFYLSESKLRQKQLEKEFLKQKKFIENTEDFIRRNMAGQKTKMAQSRQKMLDKLEKVEMPKNDKDLKIKFEIETRSGEEVLKLKHLDIGFDETVLCRDINQLVKYQDRIAVLGPNGCGKSTLLKTILGEIKPLRGEIKIGSRIKIGYYDQMHIKLNDELTVLDTIWNLMPGRPIGEVLSYLAKFDFTGDNTESLVSTLSGGEKARLYLSLLILRKPNLIILDEPTNHLDLRMIDNLEKGLREFEGTLIFVSHDRYFIDRIANRKWVIKDFKLFETDKDLTEIFADEVKKVKLIKTEKTIKKKKINPYLVNKLLEEIDIINETIEAKKHLLKDINEQMADPKTYKDSNKIKDLVEKSEKIKIEINKLMEEVDEKEIKYLEWTDE